MAKKKGTKKSTTKKITDEDISKRLYEWIAEGYDVELLMKAVQSKNHAKIQRTFKRFDKNIRRMAKLRDKLEEMGYDEDNPRFNQISKVLKDPDRVEEVEGFLQSITIEPKLKELQAELASLNIAGFEKEAKVIKAKFEDVDDLEDIEKEIKALKRRIKEKFFEEAFEDVVVTKKAEEANTRSTAETIFLLHRDGTLLAVKSKIPPKKLDKRLMSRMVMAIREQMSKAFKEGQHVHSLSYEGHTIILEDSIHVYAAVVVAGEATPVMYKIILKALQIMERKLKDPLENWTGDRSTLDNLEKYTTAIFQAFEKLG